MRRRAVSALVAVALVAVATACGGSGGDKAGGGSTDKPVVLTLESEDDLTLSGAPEFAEAVERLSDGSLRIDLVPAGRGNEADFERGVVEDVRAGRAQLGIVGVRVWDTLGVMSFQALLAPLLVDGYELERRVLESPLADRMLDGVEQAGVVGIALLPGPLRRPFGLSRTLLGPADYRGATIGIRPGGVATTTFRTLGASAEAYVPGDLTGLDAAEVDPKTIAYNGWQGHLTTNVVLWPKPYSIVMNRAAHDQLSPEQRDILGRAGREALAPELRQTVADAAAGLSEVCALGVISVVTASPSDLAALREAVLPAYAELQRNEQTRQLIAEIRDLRRGAAAETLTPGQCRGSGAGGTAGGAALEGRWRLAWTRAALVAAGVREKYIPNGVQRGSAILEFREGRYRLIAGGRVRATATYTVNGDVLGLVHGKSSEGAYAPGQVYRQRWSIYRDSLTFRRVAGSDWDAILIARPLTRVP